MIEVDFHGKTVEDAKREVVKIIDEVRLRRESKHYCFITGFGFINSAICDLLMEHCIAYEKPEYNRGQIIAEIE